MALVGSYDTLEVAVRDGSAASLLGAEIGDEVTVRMG
ncbi:MAG: SAM-dependent chlorinase/fluorinase [SAR202 cluster bacterium]|nr:SAM-dependent chlorinase/fluorinase [SAR202 cluster bacterium]